MNPRQDIVLSIYFSPTGAPIIGNDLYNCDTGYNLSQEIFDKNLPFRTHYKIGFNGCDGLLGYVFASGIDEQCQQVVSQIIKIREKILESKSSNRIVINCYGYSRGGATALMLAKMLGQYPIDMVEVNLVLLDPVPGNSIISAKLDLFDLTLANQVIDLSSCHNLKRVISIYHAKPSPEYFFSPLRPSYPANTLVEDNIVPSLHYEIGNSRFAIAREITTYFKEYMGSCGVNFSNINNSTFLRNTHLSYSEDFFNQLNDNSLPREKEIFTRSCHSESPDYQEIQLKRPNIDASVFKNFDFDSMEKEKLKSITTPDIKDLCKNLQTLADAIFEKMTPESQISEKGALIKSFKEMLTTLPKDKAYTHEDIKRFAIEYLRILSRISLQRDRKAYSLFTTTRAGDTLKNLLKNDQYIFLRHLVSGTTNFMT